MIRSTLRFPLFVLGALGVLALAGCTEETPNQNQGGGGAGTSGLGTAGTGTAGTGTAGTGTAGTGTAGTGTAGTGTAGTGTAGTGTAGTGTAGTGATDEQITACIADFMASGNSEACGMCACTECIIELGNCTEDTLPGPNPTLPNKSSGEICAEILECSGTNNCSGDACWCGCTTGTGCCMQAPNYNNSGPCKGVINQGGSEPDLFGGTIAGPGPGGAYYPNASDETPGPGKPIGNSNAVGTCLTSKCSVCQ